MCDCSDNPAKFYKSNKVKGRKEYECAECLRIIRRAEVHEYVSGMWEGDFATFRTCQQCLDTIAAMELDCFCHTRLVDDVSQFEAEIPVVEDFRVRRDQNYLRLKREKLNPQLHS